MSYIEKRKKYPDLKTKKSEKIKGIIFGSYIYTKSSRYKIMQDDLDYARIQSINLESEAREAYLSNCESGGKIIIKAKLKSVWNEEN